MEGPAQKEIIQTPEQHSDGLHKEMEEQLGSLGHQGSTKPAGPIPLTDELKEVGVDLAHIAGSGFKELVTGGESQIRTTESKKPLSIAAIRQAMRNKLLGRFNRKAA